MLFGGLGISYALVLASTHRTDGTRKTAVSALILPPLQQGRALILTAGLGRRRRGRQRRWRRAAAAAAAAVAVAAAVAGAAPAAMTVVAMAVVPAAAALVRMAGWVSDRTNTIRYTCRVPLASSRSPVPAMAKLMVPSGRVSCVLPFTIGEESPALYRKLDSAASVSSDVSVTEQ